MAHHVGAMTRTTTEAMSATASIPFWPKTADHALATTSSGKPSCELRAVSMEVHPGGKQRIVSPVLTPLHSGLRPSMALFTKGNLRLRLIVINIHVGGVDMDILLWQRLELLLGASGAPSKGLEQHIHAVKRPSKGLQDQARGKGQQRAHWMLQHRKVSCATWNTNIMRIFLS